MRADLIRFDGLLVLTWLVVEYLERICRMVRGVFDWGLALNNKKRGIQRPNILLSECALSVFGARFDPDVEVSVEGSTKHQKRL